LSYNQSNFINNSARTTKSLPLFDPKDLISNNNDDEKTLQQKNKRLIQLVVQSSSKIAELVSNFSFRMKVRNNRKNSIT
jgi:hypothetical protein